jgi:hypothetical protein
MNVVSKAALAGITGLLVVAAVSSTDVTEEPDNPKETAKTDRWEAWRGLVGTWDGTSEGKPGKGTVKLEVEFVMNERYLRFAASADYKNDKGGEHHEDLGFVSFDRKRAKYVFRQFHIEGFVNQYTLTSNPKADGTIELTSESCENTPPGWKARETFKLDGDSLAHTFELAEPDKSFELYASANLKRRKK